MRRRASSSSMLPQLGTLAPLPFVGREQEVMDAERGLAEHRVVVLRGPAGAGKTRTAEALAEALGAAGAVRFARVTCQPGDSAALVASRAERALGFLPGALARRSSVAGSGPTHGPWLVLVDDVHVLADIQARALAAVIRTAAGSSHLASGRWLLASREPLAARQAWPAIELQGLGSAAARDLWQRLEQSYGPTKHDACDHALRHTRALPLELMRAYSCAVFGHDPVDHLDRLPESRFLLLAALACLRVPAALADLCPLVAAQQPPEPDIPRNDQHREPGHDALAELCARQLVEPLAGGVYRVHDVIRERVLEHLPVERRARLERAAMNLMMSDHPLPSKNTTALVSDPVLRVREAVHHALAAGDHERALDAIRASLESGLMRGAQDELVAMLEAIPATSPDAAGDTARARDIAALRARVAMRHGRVAEALELSLAAGDAFDAVDTAFLCYRAGDVAGARRRLLALIEAPDADLRARASATLAELELACGAVHEAEMLITQTFERDRALIDDTVRARLHMAWAAIEEHTGRVAAARASLSRAAGSSRLSPALAAYIEARRCVCLLSEGRSHEASSAIEDAERMALEVDATAVADEIRRVRSRVALHRGDAAGAADELRDLVLRLRQRGDEMGALEAEIDLARTHVEQGALSRAAELVSACAASTARRKLNALGTELQLIGAMLDMAEMRSSSARVELERVLEHPASRAHVRAEAAALLAEVCAWEGRPLAESPSGRAAEHWLEAAADTRDPLARMWTDARLSLARGHVKEAFTQAKSVAAHAERAGRHLLLCDALCLCARLSFTRGDRATARAEASRAAREAEAHGLLRAHTHARLVLAALAREQCDAEAALEHARAALELATTAGLPIARLVAVEALEAVADDGDSRTADDMRHAARATMSQTGLDIAAGILSDLGLASERPYRVVSAGGSHNLVADTDPARLRLDQRALVIDAVREVITRHGEDIADLRRRSLLKRLVFLLGGAPGRVFSKEELVETIWQVSYHPLRHDAALFTNIMRIRRLLGADGADLLRVCEDGYRLVPPKDYLFIEPVAGQAE